jgi:hypothetical protein
VRLYRHHHALAYQFSYHVTHDIASDAFADIVEAVEIADSSPHQVAFEIANTTDTTNDAFADNIKPNHIQPYHGEPHAHPHQSANIQQYDCSLFQWHVSDLIPREFHWRYGVMQGHGHRARRHVQ